MNMIGQGHMEEVLCQQKEGQLRRPTSATDEKILISQDQNKTRRKQQ